MSTLRAVAPDTDEFNAIAYALNFALFSTKARIAKLQAIDRPNILQNFHEVAANSILHDSWINTQTLMSQQSIAEVLREGFSIDSERGMLVPVGSIAIVKEKHSDVSTQRYQFLLCSVAIGMPLCVDILPQILSQDAAVSVKDSGHVSKVSCEIPEGFDSLFYVPPAEDKTPAVASGAGRIYPELAKRALDLMRNRDVPPASHILTDKKVLNAGNMATYFVISDGRRLLPRYVVEFTYDTGRHVREGERYDLGSEEVSQPLCEFCDQRRAKPSRAVLYCVNDSAYICAECDALFHTNGSAIMRRHKRTALDDTPFLLGTCAVHPGEAADLFDPVAKRALCRVCAAQRHGPASTRLVDVKPLYAEAAEGVRTRGSLPPLARERLSSYGKYMSCLDIRMKQVYDNCTEVEAQLYREYQAAAKELQRITQRKVSALLAEEMELRYESAVISFAGHYLARLLEHERPAAFLERRAQNQEMLVNFIAGCRLGTGDVALPVRADTRVASTLRVVADNTIMSEIFRNVVAAKDDYAHAYDVIQGGPIAWGATGGVATGNWDRILASSVATDPAAALCLSTPARTAGQFRGASPGARESTAQGSGSGPGSTEGGRRSTAQDSMRKANKEAYLQGLLGGIAASPARSDVYDPGFVEDYRGSTTGLVSRAINSVINDALLEGRMGSPLVQAQRRGSSPGGGTPLLSARPAGIATPRGAPQTELVEAVRQAAQQADSLLEASHNSDSITRTFEAASPTVPPRSGRAERPAAKTKAKAKAGAKGSSPAPVPVPAPSAGSPRAAPTAAAAPAPAPARPTDDENGCLSSIVAKLTIANDLYRSIELHEYFKDSVTLLGPHRTNVFVYCYNALNRLVDESEQTPPITTSCWRARTIGSTVASLVALACDEGPWMVSLRTTDGHTLGLFTTEVFAMGTVAADAVFFYDDTVQTLRGPDCCLVVSQESLSLAGVLFVEDDFSSVTASIDGQEVGYGVVDAEFWTFM